MAMISSPDWLRKTSPGKSLTRFATDARGTITIESLIVLPMYLSWFILTFFLFDLYRVAYHNEKAAYTIADLISRQGNAEPIDQDFVTGVHTVYDYMLQNRGDTWIRVTSFSYDGINDEYVLHGSLGSGVGPYGDGDLEALRDRLPLMGNAASFVLVETRSGGNRTFPGHDGVFNTFTPVRPRFVTAIPVDGPLTAFP